VISIINRNYLFTWLFILSNLLTTLVAIGIAVLAYFFA